MIIKIKKLELTQIILKENFKIKDAINIIKNIRFKIVLVVNKKNKFLGTITNGDIRRNLLTGLDLNDPIISVTNKKSVYVPKKINLKNIDKLMAKNRILSIPIIDEKRKIIGMHHRNVKKNYSSKTPIIFMAGGKGKRLMPLTKNLPKAMLKIKGKPMMENLLLKARFFGYKKFILSVNYLSQKIISYFQNGKRWRVSIDYIKEKKPLGTVGSLSLLDPNLSENFIMMNCDVVTNINILDLEDYHKNHNAFITIVAHIRKSKIEYGVLETNGIKLKNFSEKPILNHYINAGIYVFNKKILKYIRPNKSYDLPDVLNLIMKLNKKIIVYPLYESWNDVGLIKELNQVRSK
jgi:dTDP-glucose pyrophosphorylase